MPALSFEIKDGKIVDKELLWNSIKRFFHSGLSDGKYIWPMPEKNRRIRSVQQNRYYHGVVCKLVADHTGYMPDEVHQILAEMFLSYEKDGRTFTRSTTKLKTAEFEEYVESCRRWSALELQIYIPLPNCQDCYYYDIPRDSK